MTREDIIERMGWMPVSDYEMSEMLDRIERIVNRAVEAEREACIGDILAAYNPLIHGTWVEGASPIENSIKAIRARGSK